MSMGRRVKPATQQSDSSKSSAKKPRASTKRARSDAPAATKRTRSDAPAAKERSRSEPPAAKKKKKERRQNRSDDPQRALSIQLSQVRDEAHLDALVLATHDGLTIAHAGDPVVCTELAAVAPLLSQGPLPADIELPQQLLFVREVTFEGSALYLASCGDDPDRTTPAHVDSWLEKATLGVTRILAAA
jgi:hypothetical protein